MCTRAVTNGFPGVPDHINMGAEILRLAAGKLTLTNTTNLNFVASQGSIWNCMRDSNSNLGFTCDKRNLGPDFGPLYFAEPIGSFSQKKDF
jgi:hypothetical protein